MANKNNNKKVTEVTEVTEVSEQEQEQFENELEKAGNMEEMNIDADTLLILSQYAEKTLVGLDNKGLRKRGKVLLKSLIPDMEKNLLSPVKSPDYTKFINTQIAGYKAELLIIAGKLKKERKDRTEGYIKHLIPLNIFSDNEGNERSIDETDEIAKALEFLLVRGILIRGRIYTVSETPVPDFMPVMEIPLTVKNSIGKDCPVKLHYAGMREKLSDNEMLELGEQETPEQEVINQ